MNKPVTFELNKKAASLNSMLSMHWKRRYDVQQSWDGIVHHAWMAAGRPLFINPVRVHYDMYFSNVRARDYDNYLGGTKYINDALKRTFFTRDDSDWLCGVTVDFHHGARNRVIVTITPEDQ